MFYKLVFYLFDKISLFENIFEHLPLTTLTVDVQQADLRAQPLQMPHIQNAPENWEARRAVKVEEDENVCWADLEGQLDEPACLRYEIEKGLRAV